MSVEKRAQNVASGRMTEDGVRDETPVVQTLPEGIEPPVEPTPDQVTDAVAEAEAVAAQAVDPNQGG